MTRSDPMIIRSTTILCLRKDRHVAMGSDGQVTHGTTIMKQNAKKLRRMYNDTVLAGFAGATADAFTLFEKFEGKLQEYRGNLTRAAVELAKDWRMDRALRRLEALLAIADREHSLIVSGTGDDQRVLPVGNGQQRLQPAQRPVHPPVLRELYGRPCEVTPVLLQLALEFLKQREGVGCGAREPRQD